MYLCSFYSKHTKEDKGAAMTIVYQKVGVGQNAHKYSDEVVIAANAANRILFHKKLAHSNDKKIKVPLVKPLKKKTQQKEAFCTNFFLCCRRFLLIILLFR